MKWHPMSEAPTDGTRIIAIGRDPWPDSAPEKIVEMVAVTVGDRVFWERSNDGYGFTVGFEPRGWIPKPREP